MFNPDKIIRPHIRSMATYTPILPFEVLSEQLGLPAESITKLDANENTYGPLPQVHAALSDLPYAHIYPDPQSRHLRAALSKHHNVPSKNILASAGADELIDLIMRLILDPGDFIINCPPTFGMYSFDAGINDAEVISVPRTEKFELDLERIAAVVAESQPKAIFLSNPNNPDGSLIPPETIDRLLSLPLLVILDEAYMHFARPGSSRICPSPSGRGVRGEENLIVLRTFSKWAGLAGLRLGYGLFPDWIMPHLWKIKQPYNVSVAASRAGIVSLENADQLTARAKKIISERERLSAALKEIPWLRPYPSQANFILCQVIGRDAAQLKADLAQRGILIRYFNKPGLDDHIRISVGKPAQTDALLEELGTI
ncbi:MAG: histidinol-phosphate transaminase [Chloroflexota bacterium]|nr:histidinol-phosphate transaminase [Chloroflexota bacterium]